MAPRCLRSALNVFYEVWPLFSHEMKPAGGVCRARLGAAAGTSAADADAAALERAGLAERADRVDIDGTGHAQVLPAVVANADRRVEPMGVTSLHRGGAFPGFVEFCHVHR